MPGVGLGLATCAKIARRHGGKIWCDPEVQDGTKIHFTLKPIRPAAEFRQESLDRVVPACP